MLKEKALAVKKSGILEYYPATQTAADVGGLENLKEWLNIRREAFTAKAREFGLPVPRGVLLAGTPGCGKSLSAKACSNIWEIPLLKLDLGRIFGGLVGESERNMRTVIQTAEAVGACVLWLDEARESVRRSRRQWEHRWGHDAARVWLVHHLDAGEDRALLHCGHRQPHRGTSPGAAAEGTL